MSIRIFPQAITLFPNDHQVFESSALDLIPLWSGVNGVVQPNGSIAQSKSTGDATQSMSVKESGLMLVDGIGSFEFTIENNCLPVNTGGFMSWKAYFGSPGDAKHWLYEVDLNPSNIQI